MAAPRRRARASLYLCLFLVGCVTAGGGYFWFTRSLPSVEEIREDAFPVVTEIYDERGEVIGELFVERRYILPYERIPTKLIDAITSAEDADFFEHGGIDYFGIVRAALRNVQEGDVVQGASTITMQLAKSLLLTPERKLRRKLKEAVLARRIENNFTKQEILALYLNHVFFGRGAYGVEAAAREIFGKHIEELSTSEMAMIAALPKAPSTYSNPANFKRWKDRQEWILDRMAKLGKITEQEAAISKAREIAIQPKRDPNLETAPYFVEAVRQQLIKTYGDERVYKGGLRVYTTADARLSRAAAAAVQKGLRGLDKRQGWRGPVKRVPAATAWPGLLAELDQQRGVLRGRPLGERERLQALVVSIDPTGARATVAFGPDWRSARAGQHATLLLRDASWARTPDPRVHWESARITTLAKALSVGDVVWVQAKSPDEEEKANDADGSRYVTLEQDPAVQGSLIALDTRTGAVRAMVGGYDFAASEYNRAVQARRQPGSAFKPVVYAAALEKGFTPSTIVVDSPVVYADDPDPALAGMGDGRGEALEESVWKPKNYGAEYYGDTTFRTALVLSRNVVSIKILQEIGLGFAIDYAKAIGLEREPQRDLSFALGTSEVSLLELSKMYSVFASGGRRVEPFLVRRVAARDGRVLEWRSTSGEPSRDAADLVASLGTQVARTPALGPTAPAGEEAFVPRDGAVIDPVTAYIVTDLMRDVVRFGTATGANLGRPVAGKTGTTNDEGDVWFVGFTPDLVAGVWIGFDDKKPLGVNETGGHSAVPVWTEFMLEATRDTPPRDFPQPSGVVHVLVDRETGKRACPETESPTYVAFRSGTEPAEYVCGGTASGLDLPGTGPGAGVTLPTGLPPE